MSTNSQDREPDIELFVKVRQTDIWLQYVLSSDGGSRLYTVLL